MIRLFVLVLFIGAVFCGAEEKSKKDNPILGTWIAKFGKSEIKYIFKADGTLQFFERGEEEEKGSKYKLDLTKTPHHLDFIDKDGRISKTIIEFQKDGSMKMCEPKFKRPNDFSKSIAIFKKAGPVNKVAKGGDSIVGTWNGKHKKEKLQFVFTKDGKAQLFLSGKLEKSIKSYRVDYTKTPHHLDFIMEGGKVAHFTIFEFQKDGTVKMAEPKKIRPNAYNADTVIFTKSVAKEVKKGEKAFDPTGKWEAKYKDKKITLEFKANGQLSMYEAIKERAGKFKIIKEGNLQYIEADFEGRIKFFLFEVQADESLKVNNPSSKKATEFGKKAIVFKRAK